MIDANQCSNDSAQIIFSKPKNYAIYNNLYSVSNYEFHQLQTALFF